MFFNVPADPVWLTSKLGYLLSGTARPEDKPSEKPPEDRPQTARNGTSSPDAATVADLLGKALDMASELTASSKLKKTDEDETDESPEADDKGSGLPSSFEFEPAAPDARSGPPDGLVPSPDTILPGDRESRRSSADIDLDALDMQTVPGMELSDLAEMPDPFAGVQGLDAPVEEIDGRDTQWSVEEGTSRRTADPTSESDTFQMSQTGPLSDSYDSGISEPDKKTQTERQIMMDATEFAPIPPTTSTELLREPEGPDETDTSPGLKLREGVPTPNELPRARTTGPGSPVGRVTVASTSPGTDDSAPPRDEDEEGPEPTQDLDLPPYDEAAELSDSGILSEDEAISLVCRLAAARFTGRLVVEHPPGRIEMSMRKGRLVFANTEGTGLTLPDMLVKKSRITRSQMQHAVKLASETGRRIGATLVDLEYLGKRELLPTIRAHVKSLFYEACGWDQGRYYLRRTGADLPEAIEMETRLAALILEGLRRKYPEPRILKAVGGSDASYHWLPGSREDILAGADLKPQDWRAIDLLASGHTVAESASASGLEPAEAARLGYLMVLMRLTQAAEPKEPPAEVDEAQPAEPDLESDRAEPGPEPEPRKRPKRKIPPAELKHHRERINAMLVKIAESDYYTLLGVEPDATEYEIQQAHADVAGNFSSEVLPDALLEQMSAEIEQISEVLNEALYVLTHERFGELYRKASTDEDDAESLEPW
jgi:hypothetical protein